MTEYLDHVDEDDNVIGRITREEAHRDFLLHRFVAILIQTPDGRIIMQHRKRDKKPFPLHMQCSAAGHVQSGKSYEEAAQIELSEELGLAIPLQFLGKFRQHVPGSDNAIGAAFFGISPCNSYENAGGGGVKLKTFSCSRDRNWTN